MLTLHLSRDEANLVLTLPNGTLATVRATDADRCTCCGSVGTKRNRVVGLLFALLQAQKREAELHYGKTGSSQSPIQYILDKWLEEDLLAAQAKPKTRRSTWRKLAAEGAVVRTITKVPPHRKGKDQRPELSLADLDL